MHTRPFAIIFANSLCHRVKFKRYGGDSNEDYGDNIRMILRFLLRKLLNGAQLRPNRQKSQKNNNNDTMARTTRQTLEHTTTTITTPQTAQADSDERMGCFHYFLTQLSSKKIFIFSVFSLYFLNYLHQQLTTSMVRSAAWHCSAIVAFGCSLIHCVNFVLPVLISSWMFGILMLQILRVLGMSGLLFLAKLINILRWLMPLWV